MRYILSRASQTVLAQLARERTLCAFDFDGTLAPIVDHPARAGLRDRTRGLLVRLAEVYPCVILSGRARADVLGRVEGIPLERVYGSHGAEGEGATAAPEPRMRRWKAALDLALGAVPGLWVEDKGVSLAVHYRQSPRKSEVRRRILRTAERLERARVFGGKHVVNVAVDGDPHKGVALAAERDRLGCETALYVGDDQNDEDAFAVSGIVSVRVGRSRHSRAAYYLRSQSEVDTLLERMVALREQASR